MISIVTRSTGAYAPLPTRHTAMPRGAPAAALVASASRPTPNIEALRAGRAPWGGLQERRSFDGLSSAATTVVRPRIFLACDLSAAQVWSKFTAGLPDQRAPPNDRTPSFLSRPFGLSPARLQ